MREGGGKTYPVGDGCRKLGGSSLCGETLLRADSEFPSFVRLGIPKPCKTKHIPSPEEFQNRAQYGWYCFLFEGAPSLEQPELVMKLLTALGTPLKSGTSLIRETPKKSKAWILSRDDSSNAEELPEANQKRKLRCLQLLNQLRFVLGCRKCGSNKWGLKGSLPSLPGSRPFFGDFCPFQEGPNSPWTIQRMKEKGLVPQISSDSLEPPHHLNLHLRHSNSCFVTDFGHAQSSKQQTDNVFYWIYGFSSETRIKGCFASLECRWALFFQNCSDFASLLSWRLETFMRAVTNIVQQPVWKFGPFHSPFISVSLCFEPFEL